MGAEMFAKKISCHPDVKKIGILTDPDLSATPTGEYLLAGQMYTVNERAFTSDGRVFLHLAEEGNESLTGWVSTRSRKEFEKVVLVAADGSDLESRSSS